jgi:hypothetical protein
VGDIIGMYQNFETDGNLGGLAGLKPSKYKILDIHMSPMGEK